MRYSSESDDKGPGVKRPPVSSANYNNGTNGAPRSAPPPPRGRPPVHVATRGGGHSGTGSYSGSRGGNDSYNRSQSSGGEYNNGGGNHQNGWSGSGASQGISFLKRKLRFEHKIYFNNL